MKKFEKWTVAYRYRNDSDTLLDDIESPFRIIKNTWRYWCADPHLIEYNGISYVFAELYDRVLRRGVIGYCTLNDSGVSSWKPALRMPFHLSYPNIIVKDDSIYMIPESYVANEIAVYKSESFPDKWGKVQVLKSDFCAVDSTVFSCGKQSYMVTLNFDKDDERLLLYHLSENGLLDCEYCISVNDSQKRPGGHYFSWKGNMVRPAQDCSESYGCALNFYKINCESENEYQEELIKKITPDMIKSDLPMKSQGIHTYNLNDRYEIIDLKGYETDFLFYIMRPIWFLHRQIKKLFHF